MWIKKIDNFSLTRNGETARIDFEIDGNKISADLLVDGDICVDGTDDEELIEGIWNGATLFFDTSITGRTVYEVESFIISQLRLKKLTSVADEILHDLGKMSIQKASLVYGKDFFLVW